MALGWEMGMEFGMEFEGLLPSAVVPTAITTASPAYMYLNYSNPSSASAETHHLAPQPEPSPSAAVHHPYLSTTAFPDDLYNPCEEAAELEWLSQFVEDSFSNAPYPSSETGHVLLAPPAQSSSSSTTTTTSSSSDFSDPKPSIRNGGRRKKGREGEVGGGIEGVVRRCTHCASEKTPQWRTGPMGPKTLCNACGVRYKSGRLVPEYRPAASPTFVFAQHSNSHRKVMELRRQKELLLFRHDGNPSTSSAASQSAVLFSDYEVC